MCQGCRPSGGEISNQVDPLVENILRGKMHVLFCAHVANHVANRSPSFGIGLGQIWRTKGSPTPLKSGLGSTGPEANPLGLAVLPSAETKRGRRWGGSLSEAFKMIAGNLQENCGDRFPELADRHLHPPRNEGVCIAGVIGISLLFPAFCCGVSVLWPVRVFPKGGS